MSRVDPPIRRVLWRLFGRPLFRVTPHVANNLRRAILRRFGARVAPTAKVRRSVYIDRPWNFAIGELSVIGNAAHILCRAPVSIGKRCVVSQHAILASEMRDPHALGHPAQSAPVTLEDDVWVATEALVLPGSTIGAGSVVGARALVETDLPGWRICTGHPAVPRKPREFKPVAAG